MSYDDDIKKVEANIARLQDRKKRLNQKKDEAHSNNIFVLGLYAEKMIRHDPISARIFFQDYAERTGIKDDEVLVKKIKTALEGIGLLYLDDAIADALAEEQAQVEAQAEALAASQAEALLLARASAEVEAMALAFAEGETLQ